MRELVINQPSKRILLMIQKIVGRIWKRNCLRDINEDEDKLYYQYFSKGTFTTCILFRNDEIVGLGETKRERNDKYNTRVAVDVATHKAVLDYLIGTEPEYKQYLEE
mgnify:CR=1 FL=1